MKTKIIASATFIHRFIDRVLGFKEGKPRTVKITKHTIEFTGIMVDAITVHSIGDEFEIEYNNYQWNKFKNILQGLEDQPITFSILDNGWIEINHLVL